MSETCHCQFGASRYRFEATGYGQRRSLIFDRSLDLGRVLLNLTSAIAGPRPEETPQPVTLGSGHYVYVEVRDGLADDVIDCHERALRAQCLRDRATDPLCHREQRNHEIARQAQQRIDVARRSDQDMTLEDRPVIKKGDYLLITRHDRSVEFAADDLADHIAHRHEISVPPLRGR